MPKRCFPPVVDEHTHLLILGSLPGDASLAQQQYYAHRQNRFWWRLEHVLATPLLTLSYPERLQTLLKHRVGLWDVVAEAHRPGSLDSALRDAARIGRRQLGELAQRYRIVELPSSSPALIKPLAEKLAAWSVLAELR